MTTATHSLSAGTRQSAFLVPIEREQLHQFASWALIWLVLANGAFAAMWFIGGPPRAMPILITTLIGLLVRQLSRGWRFIAFVLMTTLSSLMFVAGIFNLNVFSLLHSFKFLLELDPAQSTEYIAVAVLLPVLGAVAWFCLKRDTAFTDWRLVLAAVLLGGSLAGVDEWMGEGTRGHYKRAATVDTLFESAMAASRAESLATAANRNLVIIMVESLGVPVDNPEMDRLLFRRFDTSAIHRRFETNRGTSLYYNSTSAAEVRELCGRWGDYHELLDGSDHDDCLPARMRSAGYSTHAFHSFEGSFFERESWYPRIGFDESRFRDRITQDGAQICGGVFPGACDRDVPEQLARQLRVGDRPQLVYWLTVNSHLPVPLGSNLEVDDCDRLSPKLASEFPMICRQFALWDSLETSLIEQITADDFPASDILIVGDHMPPYFDRRQRSQFAPDRVPWLHLRWKDRDRSNVQIAAAD